MTASTKPQIRESLYNHYDFRECVLHDLRWKHQGTSLEFVFDYIWSDSNGFYLDSTGKPAIKEPRMRTDLNTPLLKTVRFYLVQEFRLRNCMNESQEKEPELIDWGFSEISFVSLEDDNMFLASYRNHPIEFHHVVCRWENDRRIDLVFSRLEVL